jgi:sucrose-6-phosphate hydrolase SacC (GH32 family)
MYFNGNYHLFFQYNPESAKWGDMHWYHVSMMM